MPIEIPELTVKPSVNDGAGIHTTGSPLMSAEEKEALIKEIVSRVLQELEAAKTKSATLPDSFR